MHRLWTLRCAYARLLIPAARMLWGKLCVQVLTEQIVISFSDRCLCLRFAPRAGAKNPGEALSVGEYAAAALSFRCPPFPPFWLMEELVLWGFSCGAGAPEADPRSSGHRAGCPAQGSLTSPPDRGRANAFPPKLKERRSNLVSTRELVVS